MMYLNLFKRWMGRLWDNLFPRGLRRSSWLPIFFILVVVLLPIVAWRLHRLGRFGALKREIKGEAQTQVPVGPRPGGLDPIVLTRPQSPGSNMPEFRSVTLLPGLGMEVLQITAFIPNKGEVELLTGPNVQDLADGKTPVRMGPNDRWGAIEVPWGGLLSGTPTPVGSSIRTNWHGKTIEAPSDLAGRGVAEGGMLVTLGADLTKTDGETQPRSAAATFKATDFDGHWTGKSDVMVTVTLNARTIDLAVTAVNRSEQPEPMGIGWHPRFILPSGNRDAAEVRLPNGEHLEIADSSKGLPSGRFAAPGPTLSRLQAHPGVLGVEAVDESVVHMKPGLMDAGEMAELRDLAAEFGLRLVAQTPSIREMRVASPAGSNYISLGAQSNLDDPLGKEWAGSESTITTLAPGQSLDWKVQLEIFAISGHVIGGR